MFEITADDLAICVDCLVGPPDDTFNDLPADDPLSTAYWVAWRERIDARWGEGEGFENSCNENCEGWFSWTPCDGCGSSLGGERHPAIAYKVTTKEG